MRAEPQPERVERQETPRKVEEPAAEPRPQDQESVQAELGRDRDAGESKLDGNVVTYSVDSKTREIIARVVDRESGEVIREMPSEQLRAMQRALEDASKKLFDRIA